MIDEETIRLQEILKYMVETNLTYTQEALLFIINSKGKLVIYTTSNLSDMKNKISLFNHNKVISPNDRLTLESSNFIEYMNNDYYQKPRSNLVMVENELHNTDPLNNKVHQIIVPQNNNNLNFVNYYKPKTEDDNYLISPDQSKEDRKKNFINSKAISRSNCFKCLKKKDNQIKTQKEKPLLNKKRIKVDTNMENEYIIKKEVFESNEMSLQDGNILDKSFIDDNNYNNNIINEPELKQDNLQSKSFSKLECNKETINKVSPNQPIIQVERLIDSANNTISTIPPVITKSTNNTVFSMLKDIKSLTKNQTNELKQNLKPKLKVLNDSFVNKKKDCELLLNKSKNVLLKVYDKLKQDNNKDETCLSEASDNTFIDNLAVLNYHKENDISPIKSNNNINMPRKQTIEENLVPKKLLNHSKFGGNNNQMATGGIFTKNSNVFLYEIKTTSCNEADTSKLDNPS